MSNDPLLFNYLQTLYTCINDYLITFNHFKHYAIYTSNDYL